MSHFVNSEIMNNIVNLGIVFLISGFSNAIYSFIGRFVLLPRKIIRA